MLQRYLAIEPIVCGTVLAAMLMMLKLPALVFVAALAALLLATALLERCNRVIAQHTTIGLRFMVNYLGGGAILLVVATLPVACAVAAIARPAAIAHAVLTPAHFWLILWLTLAMTSLGLAIRMSFAGIAEIAHRIEHRQYARRHPLIAPLTQ